jgi:hypothetical protein
MNNIRNLIIRYRNNDSGDGFLFMILSIIFIIIIISVVANIYYFFFYGEEEVVIRGCKIFRAKNYNPRATIDDGSCLFTREDSCNGNGEPGGSDPHCTCDNGYGGRNCKKSMETENKNISIQNKVVNIDGEEYIVNNFNLSFDDEKNLLSHVITINGLDLGDIYINPENNNYPPLPGETDNKIINNSYFGIGPFEPDFIEQPTWPNLDRFIWFKVNMYPPKNTPIQFFQLTLKSDTNKGDVIYEYGDSTLNDYLKFNFNIENGKLIVV